VNVRTNERSLVPAAETCTTPLNESSRSLERYTVSVDCLPSKTLEECYPRSMILPRSLSRARLVTSDVYEHARITVHG